MSFIGGGRLIGLLGFELFHGQGVCDCKSGVSKRIYEELRDAAFHVMVGIRREIIESLKNESFKSRPAVV